jgi:hypothetical protein
VPCPLVLQVLHFLFHAANDLRFPSELVTEISITQLGIEFLGRIGIAERGIRVAVELLEELGAVPGKWGQLPFI